MEAPWWWPLVTVLMAGAHCVALVDQEASDLIHSGPQDSSPGPALPCHKVSVSNIDFAFKFYRQLAVNAPGENILFSPVSISLALAMLSWGAPVASRTKLLEGLGFNLIVVPEVEIQEGFWDLMLRLPGQGPRLLLTMAQCRFSGLGTRANQSLEEAQKHIDEYIGKQTQGKLGAWEKDLSSETTAVLVNHMLLRDKTEWMKPFDSRATSPKEFFVGEHRAVWVPMMKEKASHRFLHDPALQCSVLQMDHAGNTTTFFIFPNRGKMRQLEDALLPETLIKWDSLLRTRELDFHFPKFSISRTYRLEMLLPQVTVGGGFPGQPGPNISKVTHKAMMTLDKKGSEAAAATSIQFTPRPHPDLDLPPAPGTEFTRPFLVMTFHMQTGSMLFLGKIVNPLG
ncbi:PREDICTED: putative serpin A13 [Colobus angolensis palliatus]|uniref:putative serpin A13 n=1 Tax=Colobus angolensis palliatus TaxID=336983 RepID=UPI0005F452B9|nr:PREDICTED: putative serpin A13 [Colobus angolensis palliatus]